MMKNHLKISVLFCFLCLSFSAYGAQEHTKQFNNGLYQVHYNIFNSALLTAEVADEYQIERAKNKALINIVVQKKQADGRYKGIAAKVDAEQFDLIQHIPIHLKTISEKNAIYYIGAFDIQNNLDNYFTITVQVDGVASPFVINLQKRLYIDD